MEMRILYQESRQTSCRKRRGEECELVDCCRDNRVIVLVTLLCLINVSIATIHLLMDVILTFLLELLCM